jgi:hypothetical protein
VGAKDPGELPAVFTVTAGDGTKYVRVQVSETTTVTPAGGTSIRIGGSGEFVTTPLTLAANTNQDIYFKDAGSFTIPQRKLVFYLFLSSLGSSAITGDITGMKLTTLYLSSSGSSSAITGKITGMELRTLFLDRIRPSVINGEITGKSLSYLYLRDIGSSLTYGTSSMNITSANGIKLLGDTVFATAEEYEQLFIDAAESTWGHSTTRQLTITGSGKNFHRDYYDWGTFSATPGASSPTPSAIAIKSLVKRGTNPVVVTLEGISAYSYAGGFPENFENWWAE